MQGTLNSNSDKEFTPYMYGLNPRKVSALNIIIGRVLQCTTKDCDQFFVVDL